MARETNIPNFSTVREHEEADTLLILHCPDVAKSDPFSECVAFYPDTNVFFFADSSFPRTDAMYIIPNWSRRSFAQYQHQQVLQNNWIGTSDSVAWFPCSDWM